MSSLDLTIVVLSLVGLVALAGWLARRQRHTADYYLGGGRLPAWALGLSLAANQVSAISLIGAPAFVALRPGGGLGWLQYELAVPLAMAALVVWGVPFLRRAAGAEVYEVVEARLGPGARRLLAAFFLVGRGLGAGVVLYASSLVVDACTAWGFETSLLVVGTVAVAYTALGGLTADVISDVLQFGLLWGATVVVTVVLGLRMAGRGLLTGIDPARLVILDLNHHGLGDGATFAFWPMLIGGFFLYVSYYGCDQTQAQRILAAADADQARRALTVASLVRFPLVLTYCLFGLMLAAFLAATPDFALSLAGRPPDALVPQFLVTYLPTGIVGVVVAGILAAALSSIDSALNSLSAVVVEEFSTPGLREDPARQLWWARVATIGWGVAATTAAWFLLAWRSRRADGWSAVAGAVAGLLANLALAVWAPGISWLWWNVVGCGVTLAVGVAFGRSNVAVERVGDHEGRGYARLLVVYFAVIVILLAVVTL